VVGVLFLALLSAGLIFYSLVYVSVEGLALAIFPASEAMPLLVYPVLIYVAYFVVPACVFLPILIPLALTWHAPDRIVVFRRFNTRAENRALRRLATRHLARFGHVFTLADSQIRRSWLVRVPLLLGQLNLLNFRPRRVVDERGLTRLRSLLTQQWRLNLNWLVSFRKIFPVQSSDACWQSCVATLLDGADVVVMDITRFSESMSWELQECHRRGLFDRLVLVAEAGQADDSRAAVARLTGDAAAAAAVPLFTYGRKRLDDPDGFVERVATLCAREDTSFGGASTTDILVTVGTTLALSLALASAGVALTAPYVWPDQTARYSPFRAQVLTAFFAAREPDLLRRVLESDREWTLAELRRHVESGDRSGTALLALDRVGDVRDVPLLVRAIAERWQPPDPTLSWWQRLWRGPGGAEQESLRLLVRRLGLPAFSPLVTAVAMTPGFPYDEELYLGYVAAHAPQFSDVTFEPLLASPSEGGRLIGGLTLARRGDLRATPILLESLRATSPPSGVKELLSSFQGRPGLQREWIAPYVLGNDEAARRAVLLALNAPDPASLLPPMAMMKPGVGQQLLSELVDTLRKGDAGRVRHVRTLLADAPTSWVNSLLTDKDGSVRMSAAYLIAERGDASFLPVAVATARERGQCPGFLFGTYECNPYETGVVSAIDRLHAARRAETRLALDADVTGLPPSALASLFRLAAGSRDAALATRLVEPLQPATRDDDASAVGNIVNLDDEEASRLLVRLIPRDAAAPFTAAMVRGLPFFPRTDICALAREAGRADVMAGLEAAGRRCP
jgi:hypothetical protein